MTTSTLSKIDQVYNTRYGLLICQRCEYGVPFSRAYNHARAASQKIFVHLDMLNPTQGASEYRSINHGLNPGMTKAAWERQVQSELKAKLGQDVTIHDLNRLEGLKLAEVENNWYQSALPLPGQIGRVIGLRVIPGLICELCPDKSTAHCTTTVQLMESHRSRSKGHIGEFAPGTMHITGSIQSMTGSTRTKRWFPVPATRDSAHKIGGGESTSEIDGEDDEDVAELMIREKREMMGSSEPTSTDIIDARTLAPFYRDHGIYEFLQRHPRDDLLRLFRIPSRKSRDAPTWLKRLYTIVTETFLTDCDMATHMNPVIRRLLMQCDA